MEGSKPKPDRALLARERAMRQERERKAELMENKQRLKNMVSKRMATIELLRKVLLQSPESFWLHSAKMSADELNEGFSSNEMLLKSFYHLAYSIFAVKERKRMLKGVGEVVAYAQLLEEWEYHFKGQAMFKFVMAYPCTSVNPSRINTPSLNNIEDADSGEGGGRGMEGISSSPGGDNGGGGGGSGETKPVLYKFNNSIVYEYLQLPHVPLQHLGNAQVLHSLTDALATVYRSFLHPEALTLADPGAYDTMLAVDTRLKAVYLAPYMNEISEFALSCIEREFQQM